MDLSISISEWCKLKNSNWKICPICLCDLKTTIANGDNIIVEWDSMVPKDKHMLMNKFRIISNGTIGKGIHASYDFGISSYVGLGFRTAKKVLVYFNLFLNKSLEAPDGINRRFPDIKRDGMCEIHSIINKYYD